METGTLPTELTGTPPVPMAAELGGIRGGISCCWREVLSESNMVAGLMGAGGRGTVIPGLMLGLARGRCGSSREVWGGVEMGGSGGVGGRLEFT